MFGSKPAAVATSLIAIAALRRLYLGYRHRHLALMPWGINNSAGVTMREAIRAADPRFAVRTVPAHVGAQPTPNITA